jgi:hypothetical protein
MWYPKTRRERKRDERKKPGSKIQTHFLEARDDFLHVDKLWKICFIGKLDRNPENIVRGHFWPTAAMRTKFSAKMCTTSADRSDVDR